MNYQKFLPRQSNSFKGAAERASILLAVIFGGVTLFNAYYNVRNAGKLDILVREINDKKC